MPGQVQHRSRSRKSRHCPTSEYVAAESITGTRVAAKIRDLPFTVNVITADFLDDFAAFEFREQTGYVSGVVGYETISTGYSIRGVDANVQLRNGFHRIGLIDKVNVERVEVIKSAAASIYGTVQPGGTVNIITKRPKTKPEQRVGFSAGSNSFKRVQLSSTGPAGSSDTFFDRVGAATDETKYDIPYKSKNSKPSPRVSSGSRGRPPVCSSNTSTSSETRSPTPTCRSSASSCRIRFGNRWRTATFARTTATRASRQSFTISIIKGRKTPPTVTSTR